MGGWGGSNCSLTVSPKSAHGCDAPFYITCILVGVIQDKIICMGGNTTMAYARPDTEEARYFCHV